MCFTHARKTSIMLVTRSVGRIIHRSVGPPNLPSLLLLLSYFIAQPPKLPDFFFKAKFRINKFMFHAVLVTFSLVREKSNLFSSLLLFLLLSP